ncbi:MAG: hypothetical protein LBB53_06195 [Prevotellaceae bacterium]|jgi:hypothetical protein|nr:hypothetical protein [Prevotellaceae bacterium]
MSYRCLKHFGNIFQNNFGTELYNKTIDRTKLYENFSHKDIKSIEFFLSANHTNFYESKHNNSKNFHKTTKSHEKITLHHEKIALYHEKIALHHEKITLRHEKIVLHREKVTFHCKNIVLLYGKDFKT